jgi:hypothetical protein
MALMVIFVDVLAWGWLWGLWGQLLDPPLLMVAKADCDRIEHLNRSASCSASAEPSQRPTLSSCGRLPRAWARCCLSFRHSACSRRPSPPLRAAPPGALALGVAAA